MRIKMVCLVILFTLLINYTTISAQMQYPVLSSGSAVLMYAANGQIIAEHNADLRCSPSGLTKILTCLIAAEKNAQSTVVTIDNTYSSDTEICINLNRGEQIELESLIYASLVANAGDATMALAEFTGGSISEFVSLMNQRAQQIGCRNTNFVNPTGIFNEGQYTTAADMALIVQTAMENPAILSAMKTARITLPETNTSPSRFYRSSNYLISAYIENKYIYPNALGGKSGYIPDEGYSLAAFANKGNRPLIAVVYRGTNDKGSITTFTDAIRLFEFGFTNFRNENIIDVGAIASELKLRNAENTDYLTLVAAAPLKVLVYANDTKPEFEKVFNVQDTPPLPINKGDILGSVTYIYDGKPVGMVSLEAANNVQPNWMYKAIAFVKIIWNIVWLRYLILAILLIVIVYLITVPAAVRHYAHKSKKEYNRNQRDK